MQDWGDNATTIKLFTRRKINNCICGAALFALLLFALGLSRFISSVQVFLRDTSQVLSVILTFWFWLTPIFFDEKGVPVKQYPDDSYEMHNQIFDRDRMRYDVESDSLVFSDGSILRFEKEEEQRKLVVAIGDTVFDVSLTVAGSAEKREILEKAASLLQFSQKSSQTAVIESQEGDPESIGLMLEEEDDTDDMEEEEEEDDDEGDDDEDDEDMKVSELLEIADHSDAIEMDHHVASTGLLNKPKPYTPSAFKSLRKTSPPDGDEVTARFARPDLIIILNPRENRLAVREAVNNQIPTIGIADTDFDPRLLSYAIPANDDSLRSVEYIMGVLSRAGEEGLIHRNRFADQLKFLIDQVEDFHRNLQTDLDVLVAEGENYDFQAQESVMSKYCEVHDLGEDTTIATIRSVVEQHIATAEEELVRLTQDTKGWSMQQILDQVKTSKEFDEVPIGLMEEIARNKMTNSRHAWAEARDKVTMRSYKFSAPTEKMDV